MICPKCGFEQPDGQRECIKCSIVFSKYKRTVQLSSNVLQPDDRVETRTNIEVTEQKHTSSLTELLFPVDPETNVINLWGRLVLLLILILWGMKFIFTPLQSNYAGESFLHLINLPFHEAGHILFRPLGRFMTVLGGSLMQLIVPLICLLTFLLKTRDAFAAAVSLWWLGESMMDLAPYINDARELTLMLVGGVTGRDVEDYHDWEFILRELGLLKYDHMLATVAQIAGIVLMIGAFAWGIVTLVKHFRAIRSQNR